MEKLLFVLTRLNKDIEGRHTLKNNHKIYPRPDILIIIITDSSVLNKVTYTGGIFNDFDISCV